MYISFYIFIFIYMFVYRRRMYILSSPVLDSEFVTLPFRTIESRTFWLDKAIRADMPSGHGRFILGETEAGAIFEREQWRLVMRRAGVSGRDCESIKSAFVYNYAFYETIADNLWKTGSQ